MHERSIVRALLNQAHELKTEQNARRVLTVRVSVGEFSGVEPQLVQSAFDELVGDSLIPGAQLELRVVPIEARCQACSHDFGVKGFRFHCPRCGESRVKILRGEGLVLESVTLEENDDRQESG